MSGFHSRDFVDCADCGGFFCSGGFDQSDRMLKDGG